MRQLGEDSFFLSGSPTSQSLSQQVQGGAGLCLSSQFLGAAAAPDRGPRAQTRCCGRWGATGALLQAESSFLCRLRSRAGQVLESRSGRPGPRGLVPPRPHDRGPLFQNVSTDAGLLAPHSLEMLTTCHTQRDFHSHPLGAGARRDSSKIRDFSKKGITVLRQHHGGLW